MALTLCIYLFSFRNSNCTETSAPTFPLGKWQRNNAPRDAEQRILWQVEATWTMWNMLWEENLPIKWIQKSTARTKIKPTVLTPSSKKRSRFVVWKFFGFREDDQSQKNNTCAECFDLKARSTARKQIHTTTSNVTTERHFDDAMKTHWSLKVLTGFCSWQRIFNQLATEGKKTMFFFHSCVRLGSTTASSSKRLMFIVLFIYLFFTVSRCSCRCSFWRPELMCQSCIRHYYIFCFIWTKVINKYFCFGGEKNCERIVISI